MNEVIVAGAGAHCKVVLDILMDSTDYKVIGLLDSDVGKKIFDIPVIGTDEELERLRTDDSGIVRNRLKIEATRNNARLFLDIQSEFGSFHQYLRSFFPSRCPVLNHWEKLEEVPVSSAESDAISRDMKRRGFKFFGTTICYAFLQATGFVNDHLTGCRCFPKTNNQ